MANQQLRQHTDACDRVGAIFQVSPWEVALLPSEALRAWFQAQGSRAAGLYAQALAVVVQHQYAFWVLWLFGFLSVPWMVFRREGAFRQEKERLLQAVKMEQHSGGLRLRATASHKRCVV